MINLKFLLLPLMLALFSTGVARGSDVGSHGVSFDFQEINEISITGSPNLSISSALAGQEPSDAMDKSASCAITTNGTGKRITASIDTAMPTNAILKVAVVAPAGSGTSAGEVILSTPAVSVVTGINQVAATSLAITYKFSATVKAGVLPTDTRTVTFTLSD
jgi:hypothetical protein